MKAIIIKYEHSYQNDEDNYTDQVIRADPLTEWEEVGDLSDADITGINQYLAQKYNRYSSSNFGCRLVMKDQKAVEVVKESLVAIKLKALEDKRKRDEQFAKQKVKDEKKALAAKKKKEKKDKIAYLKLKARFEKDQNENKL